MPRKNASSAARGGSRGGNSRNNESDSSDEDENERRHQPRAVDHVSSDDDEEISEDEAFNSEDERKYGSLFAAASGKKDKGKKKGGAGANSDSEGSYSVDGDQADASDSDDTDGIASDDDDEEGDGGAYMLDLLNNLDKGSSNRQKHDASSKLAQSSSRLAESEFSTTGVKNAGITLDSLMGGIADTKGFGRVQKTFKDIATVTRSSTGRTSATVEEKKVLETTKAPVSKVVSERASRKVHYEETSADVKRWTEAVKQNREAETLDFRPKGRVRITREDLVGKFEATTDFEKEVAEALENAGAKDEQTVIRRERSEMLGAGAADADIDPFDDDDDALRDDLGANRISLDEYKKRHGELSKMRALMFYEEQKRHHINKIKSKKYRKIRKKQRERRSDAEKEAAQDEDPDLAREMEEKEEMERMKERMSLRHKNTSKWAKRVLRRGKNVDTDTRRALSAQVQQGLDLRNKMNATMDRLNADSSDEEGGGSMLDQARAILAETEKDQQEADNLEDKKGLFSLAFMKRGMEAQRERAKKEARELLLELEDNASTGSDDDGAGSDSAGDVEKNSLTKKKTKTLSAAETEKLLPKGKMVASALEFGNANSIVVGGAIDIDLGGGSSKNADTSDNDSSEEEETEPKPPSVTKHTATMSSGKSDITKDVAPQDDKAFKKTGSTSRKFKRKAALVDEAKKDEAANPWIQAAAENDGDDGEEASKVSKRSKKRRTSEGVNKNGVVNVQNAHAILGGDDESSEDENKVVLSEGAANKTQKGDCNKNIAALSQDELVRRAFATATDADIDEEFEKEKEAMRERDDPTRKAKKEDKFASGWGSWAGEGAPAPKPPRRLPKKLMPPEKKVERRKRKDDKKKRVIINEKRVKRTAQFQLTDIPYPFTSREQYERAMAGSIGQEWNVTGAVKDMTRPEILTRAGKIIQPMAKKAKTKRAPAKF